jgi:CRP-like cAMP-binding protein
LNEQLKKLGSVRHFPKGTFLFRQGETGGNLFFIQAGLVKAYYETLDGKEFIKSFVTEGEFIASMQAIVAGNPNSFTVLSLEDSVIIEVPKQAVLNLVTNNPALTDVLNSMLLKLAIKKERREYELLCMSPEERYLLFCEREAGLLGRLSQNDIARYLGITPVALSRIRKRVGFLMERPPE